MSKEASKGDVFDFPLKSIILEKERQTNHNQGINAANGVTNEMTAMLDSTTDKLNNVNGTLELLTDLNLAMEIRTSMILSPKDMMFQGLRFKLRDNTVLNIPKSSKALDILTNHILSKTDFEENMPTNIDNALFKYGADILLMLPPNALDRVISGDEFGNESFDSLSPYFGDGEISHKSASFDLVGNLNLLRKNEAKKYHARKQTTELSLESYAVAPIFKARPMQRIFAGKMDERTGAEPIMFKIPMDACLHVHEPGNPKNHVCYLIPIDENGNIISKMEEADYFGELSERLETAINSKSGEDYSRLKELGMETKLNKTSSIKSLTDLYTKEIEKELHDSLKAVGIGDSVQIKEHETFYKLMFSRAMARRKTKFLYVPEYFVDYMAFDYNTRGQGVSLLTKTQLYSSLRAVVMFSDLIRQMANSIPQTDLNITLDEDDKSPYETIRVLLAEYGRVTDRGLPLGTFSPVSLMDELRRSGVRVNVDGGTKFPGTKLEREDRQRQIATVDDQLKEDLKKAQYAGLSVPPEAIDQALQGDFAINTFTNNQLFVKRTMLDQYKYKKMLMRRIVKYVQLSGPLYEKLTTELGSKIDIEDFLESVEVLLPSADTVQLEQQIEAYEKYAEFIDTVMEAHISDSFLRGLVNADVAADTTEELRGMISAHFKRAYCVRENILPELFDLQDADNKDRITDSINEYNEILLETIGDIISKTMKKDAKLNKKLGKVQDRLDSGVPEEEEAIVPSDNGGVPADDPLVPATETPPEKAEPIDDPEAAGEKLDLPE